MSISVAVKSTCSTVGEGPHWDPATKSLLYVDILGKGSVHRWDSVTGKDESITLDDAVSFVIPTTKGDYLVGLGKKIVRLDWSTKQVTVLHEVDQGTNNRFNDAKCDPSGRLWAGTMGHETVPAQPEMEKGHLYSLEKDGGLVNHLDKVSISNGMAWSSDCKTMYYIDSMPRKVWAFDFDMAAGKISNRRVAFDYGDKSTVPDLGYPDGMCIDTEDKLWVACFYAGKVIRVDPQTGKILQEIVFPNAKRITSCCFGGPNLDELYVTCSKYGLTDEQFKNEEFNGGSVFKVTGLGVKGTPASVYDG